MYIFKELLEIEKEARVGKARGLGRALQQLTGSRLRSLKKEVAGADAVIGRHANTYVGLPKGTPYRVERGRKVHAALQRKARLNRAIEEEADRVTGARVGAGALGLVGLGGAGAAYAAAAKD